MESGFGSTVQRPLAPLLIVAGVRAAAECRQGRPRRMDGQRFDNLAKSLAGRLSRRNALRRAGAAASATLLASAGIRAVPAVAQRQDEPLYTVIRRYTLDSPTNAVRAALQRGYIEDACKAPGFIAYFAVEDEDGDFATVAVFRSQDDFEEFATA